MAEKGTLSTRTIVRGDSDTQMLEFFEVINDIEVPFALTVYTDIIMDVRENPYEKAKKVFTLSLGDGIDVTGVDDNELMITISSERSELFGGKAYQLPANTCVTTFGIKQDVCAEPMLYFRDIRFKIGDDVKTRLNGRYLVEHNITKNI